MLKLSGLGGRLYRGETSIDFVGKRKIWYSFSGLLILASAVTLFTRDCIWVLNLKVAHLSQLPLQMPRLIPLNNL